MALTITGSTYATNGFLEDYEDLAISGDRSTVFMDLVQKEAKGATASLIEWDTETIPAPASKKALQGGTVSPSYTNNTAKSTNVVQTDVQDWVLSTETQFADQQGRDDEIERQMRIAMQILRRGNEYQLLNSTASVAGVFGVTEAETEGIPGFVSTTDTVATNLDETTLMDVLGELASYTGNFSQDLVLMADADIVKDVQDFAKATDSIDRTQLDETGRLTREVSVITTSFGRVKIVPNAIMPTGKAYVLDMSSWKVEFMGPGVAHNWTSIAHKGNTIAQGLFSGGFFHVYYALKALDEKRNAIITVT